MNQKVEKVKKYLTAHSPAILTGVGIVGFAGAIILAVKATPKAEKKAEQFTEDTTTWEKVKAIAPIYAPAATTAIISAGCVIGSTSIQTKRSAALATAYELSKNALTEYRHAVVEEIGEKKDAIIRDRVAKEKVEKSDTSLPIISTGNGETLCYDSVVGTYFKSDIECIRKAVNETNFRINQDGSACLNDFYDSLKLPNFKLGDVLGWHIIDGLFEVHFSSVLTPKGEPCLCLNYDVSPNYGFGERVNY